MPSNALAWRSSAPSRTFAISISSPQPHLPPSYTRTTLVNQPSPLPRISEPCARAQLHTPKPVLLPSCKMTSRAGLRFFTNTTRQSQTHSFIRDTFRSRNVFRRHQTTTAAPAETQSFAQRMWTSPVGVKTVHFWYAILSHNEPYPTWTWSVCVSATTSRC